MLHVVVLRDEDCPSCGELVSELESLRSEFPRMRIRERMLADEPELVELLGVVATPAMVVNNELAFQGHPDLGMVRTYLRNAEQGLHDDPEAYPPDDERDPANVGQEATGSMDPAWRGSGRRPSFGSNPGGRH
jgi:hypothetical protein